MHNVYYFPLLFKFFLFMKCFLVFFFLFYIYAYISPCSFLLKTCFSFFHFSCLLFLFPSRIHSRSAAKLFPIFKWLICTWQICIILLIVFPPKFIYFSFSLFLLYLSGFFTAVLLPNCVFLFVFMAICMKIFFPVLQLFTFCFLLLFFLSSPTFYPLEFVDKLCH